MENSKKVNIDYYLFLKDLKERYPDFQDLVKKEWIKWKLSRVNNSSPSQTIQLFKESYAEELREEDQKFFNTQVFTTIFNKEVRPYIDNIEDELQRKIDLLSLSQSLSAYWGLNFEEISDEIAREYIAKIRNR